MTQMFSSPHREIAAAVDRIRAREMSSARFESVPGGWRVTLSDGYRYTLTEYGWGPTDRGEALTNALWRRERARARLRRLTAQ